MLPVTLPADDAAMSALEWPMLCAACGTTEIVLHWKLGHASHVQGMCHLHAQPLASGEDSGMKHKPDQHCSLSLNALLIAA